MNRRPIRLTQRGQDWCWCARFTLALLLTLALAAAVDQWLR